MSECPVLVGVVSVFNFPCAGWLGFFLPENAILALLRGGVVSSLHWLLAFAFVCLPRTGSPQKRVLFWLAFGTSKGEFSSQGKGVSSENLCAPEGSQLQSCGCVWGDLPVSPRGLPEGGGLGGCSPPRLRGFSLRTSTLLMSMPHCS